MACEGCEEIKNKEPVYTWSILPKIESDELPEDLEFICGSDKAHGSWKISLARIIEEVKKELKDGK